MKIVGMAGSLREGSYAKMILATLFSLAPDGATCEALDVGQLPHYNQDLEDGVLPDAVMLARQTVESADVVLIVTPEFNHSVPGVLKNALDWLSRPAFKSCMVGKPVYFCTFSPGPLGGVRAQAHLREILASMLCKLPPLREVAITFVQTKVDGKRLTDEATVRHLQQALSHFYQREVEPERA
ncbi:NAD(P)H-dependent oxidoreductase [Luteibacter flocculans]|uniref:NAD(P)H-dependent oxidoreductase n=1 Tax=Luteibacter flocculans TaxID=2780091 RepID=A0ABY4T1K5_9GAMM|nr:NADPH-dependent FMN reductase [Luteibacter flocculans]URL58490.1 NAD(P)H-dependent oxidoreductase [Luteibacter flocculans]